jgi:hypothetical protein
VREWSRFHFLPSGPSVPLKRLGSALGLIHAGGAVSRVYGCVEGVLGVPARRLATESGGNPAGSIVRTVLCRLIALWDRGIHTFVAKCGCVCGCVCGCGGVCGEGGSGGAIWRLGYSAP